MDSASTFGTVLIAGVGLIGGSVALRMKNLLLARKVIGLDASSQVLNNAIALGVIDEARLDVGEWLSEVDLVVLSAPVSALPDLGRTIAGFTRPDTLFTDVGSVKSPIAEALSHVPNFVPGHPMAGSERGGVEHATGLMLQNAVWVLTPTDDTSLTALSKVRALVEALGAAPIVMPPDAHDALVATISHLPYVASLALTHMVARDERLALLAAGGFRDLTRVASGDPRMSRDMVVENKNALRQALRRFRRELERLEAQLEVPEELLEAARESKRTRDSLPIVRRTILPPRQDLIVAVEDKPGELGRITQIVGFAGINIKDIEVLAIREQGGSVRLGLETPDDVERARSLLEAEGYVTRSRV
ncbi:prephenate dehydrogenase/arogenate dehydrogenase family protein [Deinococcus yavapaiensis]|uniref:Prephenate dehydrogenase n=1 Tax=Deinococcus yavapaiensis KR-236 TaxID=694435 RepID=A0A318SG52_9DEIO|nr:prephenate dehydrogenase/arogenate dehydrogenase family protein [Deinococcus yavapaiensis]PYE56364.1 prephenate dehydrogenase [Deinococcus yavapaiensis KR-236]